NAVGEVPRGVADRGSECAIAQVDIDTDGVIPLGDHDVGLAILVDIGADSQADAQPRPRIDDQRLKGSIPAAIQDGEVGAAYDNVDFAVAVNIENTADVSAGNGDRHGGLEGNRVVCLYPPWNHHRTQEDRGDASEMMPSSHERTSSDPIQNRDHLLFLSPM